MTRENISDAISRTIPTRTEKTLFLTDHRCRKRHRYDDIIMGFYGKAFDNGLQAKAAGSKPILFPANQNLGLYYFHALVPFDRSPSRCSHRLFV